jgi:hypothetical protein
MQIATGPSEEALDTADYLADASSLVNAPSADWFSDLLNDTGPFAILAHEYQVISNTIGEKLNALVADKDALIRVHCPE